MLGPRIAALRRDAGLSQAELARLLDISPSAIGMYEQGRREPSIDTVVILARVFHVSTDYLLTGIPTSPEVRRLEDILERRLSAAEQHLAARQDKPFTRQELAVLFAAILTEP